MGYDCYINIPEAPGESTDSKHVGWIEADKKPRYLRMPPRRLTVTRGAGGRSTAPPPPA